MTVPPSPMPDDASGPLPFDPFDGAGALADDVPASLPDGAPLSQPGTRAGALPSPSPTLAVYLRELDTERDPYAAGGVPLPDEWRCVRAIIGGAGRKLLEDAHRERPTPGSAAEADFLNDGARLDRAAEDGAHLPAGLHVVTGQTGGGKTALAVNMVRGALAGGHPAVYVSLELDGGELAARLLALETALPWWRLAQRRRLDAAAAATRRAGIDALEPAAERVAVLTPESADGLAVEVRAAALAAWRTHGRVPLVVFDYLQAAADLPTDAYRAQLREYVGELARDLRTLSRELRNERGPDGQTPDGATWPGCPVVVLSITARANVRGESAVPGLDGMQPDALRLAPLEVLKALPKEAGAVEAYAVTSWVLAGGEEAPDGTRPVAFRAAKYRGGSPGGWVPFTFAGATGLLTEAPARYAEVLEAAAEAAREKERREDEREEKRAQRGAKNGAKGNSAAPLPADALLAGLDGRKPQP